MVKLHNNGAYAFGGELVTEASAAEAEGILDAGGKPCSKASRDEARKRTIAYGILRSHDAELNIKGSEAHCEDENMLRLRFDSLASHDITYVGILQTIRASNIDYERFPVPYILSNCHNSLSAVGGTINADDHAFGFSAAIKYGGVFVPPHFAVIHQYLRETEAGCGKMILGSDSHTRFGPLGTMGFGEGGGELVKQLLRKTYDIAYPEVVGVKLTGEPKRGVGPMDAALALISAVFKNGFVKNKILEFFGSGIANISMDYRNGIDVMTTETACLSSIWATDDKTEEYLALHGRHAEYIKLSPGEAAYYDAVIEMDLSLLEPMIALPFHPGNAHTIKDFISNAPDIAAELEGEQLSGESFAAPISINLAEGKLRFGQGIIAGCAGGSYENIREAASIYRGGGPFPLSIYPASQPIMLALVESGIVSDLIRSGATLRTAFCGPCFGAGDVPANDSISMRHVTRNFANREGSKPGAGQRAGVVIMDARSIAATAKNGGTLTACPSDYDTDESKKYFFDRTIYEKTVYDGRDRPSAETEIALGPGIRDWPQMGELPESLLLSVASYLADPVTTTDELIPSGEISSFRSNPQMLAEFTLSRKDPGYVARAKSAMAQEKRRLTEIVEADASKNKKQSQAPSLFDALRTVCKTFNAEPARVGFGSLIYAMKPGDGSAREQAASCQRVLGGLANIASEYATKRYRLNLVNWGILPFILENEPPFELNDCIYIPAIRDALMKREDSVTAYVVRDTLVPFELSVRVTGAEADVLLKGGLINYYGEPK